MIADDKVVDKHYENLAKEVMINFYARSGLGRGNYDILINFKTGLKNLVGFSLNCFQNADLPDPENWSESELISAENGSKHFQFDNGDECCVIKAIQASCENDERNYVNVLPVIYQHDSSLYFTPLFRLRRSVEFAPHFVCAKGRIYEHFNDWENNNSLPESCVFMYPTNGVLNGSSVSRKVQHSSDDGALNLIGTAVSICETFGGPLGSVISSPLAAVAPIYEIYDRVSHGESINPFSDKEAAGLWFKTTVKISGPFGKFAQTLGFSGTVKTEKKLVKSEKISKDSVSSLKSLLNGDEASAAKILNEAKSLLENPMRIEDMMKVTKYYAKTSIGCLRLSILLGFYMNTKFFYYNQTKLLLINELYNVVKQIDETRSFRLTNSQEVILGPLQISMKLLENFSRDDIVKLAGGLSCVKNDDQLSSHISNIKDISKFFKSFPDFLTALMTEQRNNRNSQNGKSTCDDLKQKEERKNVEEIKFYITEGITMMNYHNQDYQLPKQDEKVSFGWFNVIRILEKRLVIFAKITNAIRSHDFNAISSGIIFQFTKHANDLRHNLTVGQPTEVLLMLISVYKILRENFIPFTIKSSSCGRPMFSIGFGIKMHLSELFNILSTGGRSIEVMNAICHLEENEARMLDEIRWNMNNDQALVKWIENSFETFDTGLKMLLELRQDVLADAFKNMVQLFIPRNEHETNGLLLIKSGVYGFLISIHVLQKIDQDERLSIMKNFEHLQDREELMNVIGRIFKEKSFV